jgi:hypothetical protein
MNGLRGLAIIIGAMASGVQAAGTDAAPPPPPAEIGRPELAAPIQPRIPGDDRPILVPTTRAYEWTFHVPVVTIEHRHIAVTTPSATTHSRRFDYDVPGLKDKRFKLWDVPEFSCKYPDVTLPNECRTVWHGVYVDLPVLVSQHAHVDVDVLRLGLSQSFIEVDVPRWTWTEKRFRFSLPAFAPPESIEPVRASLNGQRAAVTAATDVTIANIDRQIEMVQAQGEDPAALESSDGSRVDLLAQRQALLDERAQELERLAAIDTELSTLPTRR